MRVGIIGCGSIGKRHLHNLLALGQEIEVLAYDRDEDRLQDLPVQASHKILEFWEWKPEAVMICSPPESHYYLAVRALTERIQVFCEKPLATNYRDALAMLQEARGRQRVLAVGYQLRFTIAEFRAQAQGTDIEWCCSQDMSAWPSQYTKDVLEEFSHELSSAVWCNGPVEAVTAQEYPGKWDIQLRHLKGYSHILLDSTSKASRRLATASNGTRWGLDRALNDQAYLDEIQSFLDVCQGEPWDDRLCSGAEGAHVCRIIECCRESAKYHSVVNV